ncbi:MAG: CHASE2 domain-containing protein [Candidatus Marinimicrobia bacterium]|nr:CHASE2 domain-containing protein [Candidatus Neomarinimicrobiota bacterium]
MPDWLKRTGIGALIGLIAGLVIAIGTNLDGFFLKTVLDGYEFRSYDSRMKAKVANSEEASIDDIVIIDIDLSSVEGLGNYKDWPHAYHGQLIDVVTSGNPKAILFDIIFDAENSFNFDLVNALVSENPPATEDLSAATEQFLISNDPARFVESTAASNKAYHALVFEAADTSTFLYPMDSEPEGYAYEQHILDLPIEQAQHLPRADRIGNTHLELLSAAQRAGSANFPQDEDGIIRRAPTAIFFEGPQHVYPSLVMAAAMDILDVPADGFSYDFDKLILTLTNRTGEIVRELPIDAQGRVFVNYYGFFKTFYYLPYMYCFDPEMLPPEYWQDRVAIVGSSLPGLMDLRNTPVQETFAGVEIHATVMHSILNDEFIRLVSKQANFWVIVITCLLVGILVSLIIAQPILAMLVPVFVLVGWIIFAYSRFLVDLAVWEIVRPILAVGTTYLGVFLYNFLVSEKDKRFLKSTFSTYISPELIDQMYESKQEPKLGGDAGYHTAFFSDIQSFSSFSEVLEPTKMVSLMNEYLTEMTTVLLNRQGTLDKYIGDSIVAFYGSPMPVEDHEYQACMTALEMEQELAVLRAKWKSEEGWPEIVHNMQHRIGLGSGDIVTGNMGSTMRMNYTMMGDTVNIASRLEASAKQYGVYIQVLDTTYAAVKDRFEWRFLDYVRVKGKNVPVKVYELLSKKDKLDPNLAAAVAAFHEGQALYLDQDWKKAIKVFKAAEALEIMFPGRNTNPSAIYISRCEHLKKSPPGKDWDGTWTLTSK